MARRLLPAVALAALTACAAPPAAPAPTTTPSTVDAVTSCVNQLVYWAKQILGNAKDDGLDYQEMGLDGDQYEALRRIVAAARGLRSGGRELPPNWLPDQARAECAKLAAAPKPTTSGGYGWP
jgi:hypothetical protein